MLKVFKGIAWRGKSTMGWFFGLKIHLILNHKEQIMAVRITVVNKKTLSDMVKNLKGKCYANKKYIGKDVFQKLWKKDLHLITGIQKI